MTVRELIERLSQYPPELRVMVDGYENGFCDLEAVGEQEVVLNQYDKWYFGPHALAGDAPDKPTVRAVILPRPYMPEGGWV